MRGYRKHYITEDSGQVPTFLVLPDGEEWLVSWTGAKLRIKAPDGRRMAVRFQNPRVIDVSTTEYGLYFSGPPYYIVGTFRTGDRKVEPILDRRNGKALEIVREGQPVLRIENHGSLWEIYRYNRRKELVNTGHSYSDAGVITVLLYYAGSTDLVPRWTPKLARFLETASNLK